MQYRTSISNCWELDQVLGHVEAGLGRTPALSVLESGLGSLTWDQHPGPPPVSLKIISHSPPS